MPSRARAVYDLVAEDKSGAAVRSFKNSLASAGGALRSAAGLAAGAAAGGFAIMARQALVSADQVQKFNLASGASTELLSELRFAASQSGTDFDTVGKAFTRLQKNLVDASAGLATPVRAFDAIGLSVEELRKLSPDEQLIAVGDAMSRITDDTEKAARSQELFGRSGRAMLQIFANGAVGLEEYRKKARELGLSMSLDAASGAADLNDQVDILQKSVQGLVETIVLQWSPAAAGLVESLTGNIIPAISNTLEFIGRLTDSLAAAAAAAVQFSQGNVSGAAAITSQAGQSLIGERFIQSPLGAAAALVTNITGGGAVQGETAIDRAAPAIVDVLERIWRAGNAPATVAQ